MPNIDDLVRTHLTELGRMERGYVKPIRRQGRITGYLAYCADGTYLWRCKSLELAEATLRQQDLEPQSVH